MKVIIPAAGFGSRLRPHTYLIPKVLLPVAGKPIIEYIVDQAIDWGCNRFSIIHGHLHEQVESFFKERYKPLDVSFHFQDKRLGLAHAILKGIESQDKELVILLGDSILYADVKKVIQNKVTGIGVFEVPDARKYGIVLVENGKVTQLIEKHPEPPSNLAIAGVYYIRDAQLLKKAINEIIEKNITVKGEYQITDALQKLISWGEPIETFPIEDWFDCGKPETLIAANRYLLEKNGGDRGSTESRNAVIIEPVVIGDNCILERSIVGPYITLGSGSVIRDSVVTDSIIGSQTVIEHANLDCSLVGNRCQVCYDPLQVNISSSSCIEIRKQL